MIDLTHDELELLRICRRNADDQYVFSLACVPERYLNTELRALRERGYIAKDSGIKYKITAKGRDALHQALVLAEASAESDHQRAQEKHEQEVEKALDRHANEVLSRKEARRSWTQWGFDFALSVLSLFAGGLLEALTGWFSMLVEFFH